MFHCVDCVNLHSYYIFRDSAFQLQVRSMLFFFGRALAQQRTSNPTSHLQQQQQHTHTHTRTLDRRVIQWTDRINSARKYPSTRHAGPFPRNTTDSDECWTIPPTRTLVPPEISIADAAPVLQCSMTLTLTLGRERHLCRVAGDTVWSHMACEYS